MSLLSPQDRTALVAALRPPPGFALHTAIGTTYSLDLVAMLSAPVGFTFFELEGDASFGEQAPLEMLEAIRRHAGQLVVFCEAGRISVPPKHQPLFCYLEDRIVQAKAPAANRSFHPKLWVIRYASEGGDVVYRLLCMSRNLTFDQSLDTLLVLDGTISPERKKGYGVNKALGEFLQALPDMAVVRPSEGIRSQCSLVTSEIATVDWSFGDLPIEGLTFWPLGHQSRRSWPFKDAGSRFLIASPFVSSRLLNRICVDSTENILISRRTALDTLDSATLGTFRDTYVMRAQLEAMEPEADAEESSDRVAPNDLHAKLYIADRGWDASIWTGSANATIAAFDGNVEFLVELLGKKSRLGIDAFLAARPGSVGILDMVEKYVAPNEAPPDVELAALEERLEDARRALSRVPWTIAVAGKPGHDQFTVRVSMASAVTGIADDIVASVRLLSLGDETARNVNPGEASEATFDEVSLEGLTSFLVLELVGRSGGRTRSIRCVVNAALLGAPPNRRERLLQGMLRDRQAVVRFLLLLLGDAPDVGGEGGYGARWSSYQGAATSAASEALFEPLLKAFEREPGRLTAVISLVRELQGTSEGSDLVPEGLSELLSALELARAETSG